ncbi:MAG: adenosine deaminase [Verrucomicrobiota bacterium]|nr:adenosine deaminase [Verrucomicrobiota bacterium]
MTHQKLYTAQDKIFVSDANAILQNSDDLDSNSFDAVLQSLPKTDMHLHIEGAISLDEYAEVNPIAEGWEPNGWAPDYRYPSFAVFEKFILGYADKWFDRPERYHLSAQSLFRRKIEEGVRYLECSFAFIVCEQKQLPIDEVVDAITSAIPSNLHVRLFCGLHHDSWSSKNKRALEQLLELKGLTGIDLHGPERYPVGDRMADYWKAARQAGKFTKAHAGELGGAWHVREAVEKLGVRRIEHGFRAGEDASVVDLLRSEGVVLDVCPISNFKLKTVDSYKNHPFIELCKEGIQVTINTDDPFIFGNSINDEYKVLYHQAGLSSNLIFQLVRSGFEVALLNDCERKVLTDELDSALEIALK